MSGLIDILKLPAKARNIELNEKVISAAGITPILIKMRNDDLIRLLKEKSKPHHKGWTSLDRAWLHIN